MVPVGGTRQAVRMSDPQEEKWCRRISQDEWLPLTWRGARWTIDFGSFRLRHLCLDIGLRARTRGTLLVTFVGSFHHSKIMLGVLVKVLCVDAIATCRRLPTKGDVAVKNLMRVASDFDVGTVTIEGLTSGGICCRSR